MQIRRTQLTLILASLLAGLPVGMSGLVYALDKPAAEKPLCIVPAKPGGGMDLTCKLAQTATAAHDMHISYLPGGVGAIAWTTIISQRKAEANTLVA